MKVLVQYLVEMTDGSVQEGRQAWIGRDSFGQLTFGTIYVTEQTARDDITQDELNYLHDWSFKTKKFRVLKTVE